MTSGAAVVVIDDDEIMRELMADWLEAAGYRVVKAEDCDHAIDQVKTLQPAAVVTDMFMPGPCAEEAIAQIRAAAPHAAIVAVSGYFKSGCRISWEGALAAGADRALAKPMQRGEFLKAVDEVLRLYQL